MEARVVCSTTIVLTNPRYIQLTLIDRWSVRYALTGVRTAVEARVCGSATVVPANPLRVHLTLIDRWLVRLTLTLDGIAVEPRILCSTTFIHAERAVPLTSGSRELCLDTACYALGLNEA